MRAGLRALVPHVWTPGNRPERRDASDHAQTGERAARQAEAVTGGRSGMTWEERLAQEGYTVVNGQARRSPKTLPLHLLPTRPLPPRPVYRSKTEARYAALLEQRLAMGDMLSWRYEALKLRLAANTFYTPDFLVQGAGQGQLELHEVKGAWVREDARIKIKVAAQQYPYFLFLCATW